MATSLWLAASTRRLEKVPVQYELTKRAKSIGAGIALMASAAVVDMGDGGVDRLDDVDDEAHEGSGRNPVALVRTKK